MDNNNNREKKKRLRATKTVECDKKRSWSDLPYDILESIKKKLYFIDQVNFRAVCKSWSCAERVPSLQQIPWLLVFDNVDSYLYRNHKRNKNRETKEKHKVDSCKLIDSKNKKTYTIDESVIKDKLKITSFDDMIVRESKYGWLLISHSENNSTRLYLYSPFFGEGYNFIELPVLKNCLTFCATFTSNPLDEDCKILTLSKNVGDNTFQWKEYRADNTIVINTYRCGQGSWSSQNFECTKQWDYWCWKYSEGSFYHRTRETWNANLSKGKMPMGKFNLALEEWTVLPRLPPSIEYHQHYMVTSPDGELFLILECNLNERNKKWHYDSRIYRLDFSSMIWEDLDSIGDRVLFFGEGYNSILHSSVLKLNGEQNDISDKIYYCKNYELRYCSVHDYTLKFRKNKKPPQKQIVQDIMDRLLQNSAGRCGLILRLAK